LHWDVLLELAEEHGVQGMLARTLEGDGYSGVPTEAREKLQTRLRGQQLFALSLTAELFRILRDFAAEKIESVPVKGPVLSAVAYSDAGVRRFGDLDLLVRHRDIQGAIGRMAAMGFESKVPVSVLQSEKIPGEYVFRRTGTPLLVELHTEQTFRHYPRPMRIDEMLGRKRSVQLDGRQVPALGLEDELLFNCVHGGKDFWERLMWVADIAALLTRYPKWDWEKVWEFAQEVRAERMLLAGVQLAALAFGIKLPTEIAERVAQDSEVERLCARILEWLPFAGHRPPGIMTRAGYRVQMAGGGAAGLAYLTRLSLSPTEDDWTHGRRKSWVREALLRPFRLIRKYGAEQ
jgi:hypothetical protein